METLFHRDSAPEEKNIWAVNSLMSDRYMPSIFPSCDKLKQAYDKCFQSFFQQYISPDYHHSSAQNPCEELHSVYRECVEKNLSEHRPYEIDLEELRKEVLFTEKDCLHTKEDREKQPKFKMEPINQGSNGVSSDQTSDSRFNLLERTLENFQENARHLGVIASDFNSQSQELLNQKIHTIISGLNECDALKNQFSDVKVPIELLDNLDQGQNPQLYTRDCLERTKQKNKEVNGKIEIYKKFHASLLEELSLEMPTDTVDYLKIRKPRSTAKSANPSDEN
uniref:Mediator of RNA polymerase II transcription subunit 10 n=1 Tax=Ditylenchus dipsaci TaxID=166011 RepID=A0A915EHH6_9BILA